MTSLPTAHEIARKGHWSDAADTVTLSYEDRFLRRKVLTAGTGAGFLVDLAHTESLDEGDAFRLGDGSLVAVRAAVEPLLAVTGADLPRIAWHIGNRHTPCQIEPDRLLIQRDHVIRDMLERIGATVTEVNQHLHTFVDDLVRPLTLYVGDNAYAASIVFLLRRVQTFLSQFF